MSEETLRILILEDIPTDAELIEHELRKAGMIFCSRVVATRDDFIKEIEEFTPDLIFADYQLPQFDGLSALEIAKKKHADVPFILVSGSIGEELAVEALKGGATDYVLKDRLFRLRPVINRALHEVEERIGRKQAEEALKKEKAFIEGALNSLTDIFFVFDFEGKFLRWNKALNLATGYNDHEIAPMKPADLFSEADAQRVEEAVREVIREGKVTLETTVITKDGTHIPHECIAVLYKDYGGNPVGICGVGRDIAERKRAEEAIKKLRYQNYLILNSAGEGIVGLDLKGNHTFVNPAAAKMLGYEVRELIGQHSHTLWHHSRVDGSPYPEEECPIYGTFKNGAVTLRIEEVFWRKDGTGFPVAYTATPMMENDQIVGAVVSFSDISVRKQAEVRIQMHLDRLAALRAIDMAITASLDLRVTFNVFLDQATTHLGVDAADVLLLDPHTHRLEYAAGRGFQTSALKHTSLALGEGYAGKTALERHIVSIPKVEEARDILERSPLLGKEGFRAYYGVPLIAKGQIKGVLEIFHRAPLQPDQEWLDFLEALAGQAAIAIDNAVLFNDLQRSNVELVNAYDTTLEGWSRALDLRDKETEGHSERVTKMTSRLARAMDISNSELVHVRRGALLHDIGKMGIPDKILLKPGPLTKEEWEIMHKHPVYAYELLYPIAFLRPAVDIPYCHHEKWDGTGYPRGLKGDQIPLPAQVFAIADVWDALRSDRPYRHALADEKGREHILQQAGKHFNPKVVEVFLKVLSD